MNRSGPQDTVGAARRIGWQPMRFALVGCSNFLVSLVVFRLLLLVPVTFAFRVGTAQILAYAVGTVWSFFMNRRFTFRSHAALTRQFARFVALQASLAAGSALVIDALAAARPESTLVIWVVVMAIVGVINYVLCRTWVYRAA